MRRTVGVPGGQYSEGRAAAAVRGISEQDSGMVGTARYSDDLSTVTVIN